MGEVQNKRKFRSPKLLEKRTSEKKLEENGPDEATLPSAKEFGQGGHEKAGGGGGEDAY